VGSNGEVDDHVKRAIALALATPRPQQQVREFKPVIQVRSPPQPVVPVPVRAPAPVPLQKTPQPLPQVDSLVQLVDRARQKANERKPIVPSSSSLLPPRYSVIGLEAVATSPQQEVQKLPSPLVTSTPPSQPQPQPQRKSKRTIPRRKRRIRQEEDPDLHTTAYPSPPHQVIHTPPSAQNASQVVRDHQVTLTQQFSHPPPSKLHPPKPSPESAALVDVRKELQWIKGRLHSLEQDNSSACSTTDARLRMMERSIDDLFDQFSVMKQSIRQLERSKTIV
jgi:hypothetical protein